MASTSLEDISSHRIFGHDSFYFPNFVTPEEEQYLIRKIYESPLPRWRRLANRRLQIWGGDLTDKGTLLAQPMPPFIQNFPDIISRIKATGAFNSSPHKGPNHVIMNEYLPGQGIMPHEDGPMYYPVVATLSLGSHAVFHYYQYQSEDGDSDSMAAPNGNGKSINIMPVLSILLEPRSLIISSGSMYTSHLHGIDEVEEDLIVSNSTGVNIANIGQLQNPRVLEAIQSKTPLKRELRYSLTCRDVGRVSAINTSMRH